jgi:redox-sensitive bicupin YhaK (pirin superfamily)
MLQQIIDSRRRDLGGFEVGRVLPFGAHRMVGPFIFFDHIGPEQFSPGLPRTADVRPHPHIGLATVTYLFEGEIMHRDSVGSQEAIQPGEVNWMTAGSGITHSERFEKLRAEGGPLHGIQSWVALPAPDEETTPAFAHHGHVELPTGNEGGSWVRLIAGEAFGMRSPVKTLSPLFYAHCTLQDGARAELPREYSERAAFVAAGSVEADGRRFNAGQMLVFSKDRDAGVKSIGPSIVMLLGGEPVGARFIEWNFVSSSQERIEQAKADWRAGRMKLPYGDDQEFIALPAG